MVLEVFPREPRRRDRRRKSPSVPLRRRVGVRAVPIEQYNLGYRGQAPIATARSPARRPPRRRRSAANPAQGRRRRGGIVAAPAMAFRRCARRACGRLNATVWRDGTQTSAQRRDHRHRPVRRTRPDRGTRSRRMRGRRRCQVLLQVIAATRRMPRTRSARQYMKPPTTAPLRPRAASSAPRGTAHAERDHKNGGATPRARIAARNAGWCMTMAFTKLMHDLEAHGRQKRLPFAITGSSPRREGVPLFHYKSRSAATRHVNPRNARSCRSLAAAFLRAAPRRTVKFCPDN